ncbi:hypothetical protein POSPLADRAFT_1130040 [Postia placenta MAD-698-R-SB12]|uniref:RTA1 like protein n=1 Tax=Postia placenta MAD-698-R-SB12 TaxID=670580 RepID=A0A1X6NHL0_9APHY|nr:hypothetical protein POSPLADRAFT_1130040 [Postia placenta MAD-698-R-SB12]OSX68010.1 hypothetical protein POSPLADRAFT_1130040 [Postia placenta MAD-698-R-SB12]
MHYSDVSVLVIEPAAPSQYGYVPTAWICYLYVILFSVSTPDSAITVAHFVQALHSRLWWMLATACITGALEVTGWIGRLLSSHNPAASNPYLIQIVATIIAPTPFVACNFIILGQIIRRLGEGYSRINAKWYTIIFTTSDFVCLVVQALGGAMATGTKQSQVDLGSNIMLTGIVLQLFSITVYMTLATEFLWRYLHDRPLREVTRTGYTLDKSTKRMILALIISGVCIYIRTIELADGWHGVVIHTQALFNIFDAGMITIAMYSLNIFHPGRLLGCGKVWKEVNHGEKGYALNSVPEFSKSDMVSTLSV